MNVPVLLLTHGPVLLCGVTVVLVIGCLAMAFSRAPLHRQRLGECALFAAALWLVAALVPLPRWLAGSGDAVDTVPVAVSTVHAESALPPPAPTVELPAAPEGALPTGSSAERLVHGPAATGTESAPRAVAPIDPRGRPRVAPAPEPLAGIAPGQALVWLYLAGSGLCLCWLALGSLALARVLATSRVAPDAVAREARIAARALGLPARHMRVRIARRPVRPFCCGMWRWTVVLPAVLCEPGRAESLRHVLRHEIAHLRQGDCRTQMLAAALLPVLFFHPLYWWLRRRVRLAAEVVADELAAQQSAARDYARGLIAVLEQGAPRFAPAGALAVFGSPSEFYRRIEMLLHRKERLTTRLSRRRRLAQLTCTLALAALVGGAFGVAPATAQQDPDAKSQQIEKLRRERDALKKRIADLERRLAGAFVADPESGLPTTRMPERVTGEDLVHGRLVHVLSVEVQRGDTLDKLLRRHYVRIDSNLLDRVRALNPELDPKRMRIGQTIHLPVDPTVPHDPRDVSEVVIPVEIAEQAVETPVEIVEEAVEQPVLQDAELEPVAAIDVAVPVSEPVRDPLVTAPAGMPVMRDSTLDLATRCIELAGQLELAEREAARIKRGFDEGVVDRGSWDRAEVALRTAQRKLKVVRQLIEAEIDTGAAEMAMLMERAEQMRGLQRRRLELQALRIENRLLVLKSAL